MFEKFKQQSGFQSLIDDANRYFINVDGVIKGIDGFDLPQSLDPDGFPQVFANLWDGVRFYRVVDLMALHFKGVRLPIELWGEVEGFYIDSDATHQHASNIGYRFRNAPLECIGHPGFFYVPMYTTYGINRQGVLLNVASGLIKSSWNKTKPYKPKNVTGGYGFTSASFDIGKQTTIYRHRLLCLTFKPYPNHIDRLDVNHKNGIPGDDDLDNLEWVTRKRNLQHAYDNRLRTQNKPLLARNLRTGEVMEFASISEAGRALGVKMGTVAWRVARSPAEVDRDGFQFKLLEDPRPWVEYPDVEGAITNAVQVTPILVRDCKTGVVTEYESAREVERELGLNRTTVLMRLRVDLRGPHRGYQFKYVDDVREWGEFDPVTLDDLGSIPRVIVGRNLHTGETCEYPSIKACIRGQQVSNHLAEALRQGQQPTYPNGWQYKYVDEEWVAVVDFEQSLGNKSRAIRARHVLTGYLVHATSARELGKLLNLKGQLLGKAASFNGTCVVGLFQCMWAGDEPWPELLDTDLKALKSGESFRGEYSVLTDTVTQEQFYFPEVQQCVDFLKTIHSKPVLYRAIRKGELLDGKYRYSLYKLGCQLKR